MLDLSILWRGWVPLLPEVTRLYSKYTVEGWVKLLLPEVTRLYSEHTVEGLGTSAAIS